MDITVCSLLPYAITEIKPGLIPDTYRLEPSEDGVIPSVLHVEDGRSNLYIRDGKTYPITHPAIEIANAIVNDYCSAQLQGSEDGKPALFWVPGKLTAKEVMSKHPKELADAKKRQNVWFVRLVRLADDDWQRTHQHRMITDIQRYAARSLGLINKEWYQAPEPETYVKCPACATLVDAIAAVCANCNYTINKERAEKLGLAVKG